MKKLLATIAITLAIGLSVRSLAFAGDECTIGKFCSDGCAPGDKVCHREHPPICKTGKPCGSYCIALDKKCRH